MSIVTLEKHDARNRSVVYRLLKKIYVGTQMSSEERMTTHVDNMMKITSRNPHPENWRGWLTLEVKLPPPAGGPDENHLAPRYIDGVDEGRLAQALADRIGAPLQHYATRADTPGVLHVLCLNEDPATGHALRIGKSELRGLQETATTWLREHGYEHHPETETAAVLAAEKATLEADIERLRTEATETRAAMQDMQNAAQETSAAVGIYETALKQGKPRPRIPEPALRQAREFAREHAPEHQGMGLVGRLLERQDSMELLGCMAIIAPAMLTAVVVSALAVTVYKAKREQDRSRDVGAAPTPPAEKENAYQGREGLETMLTEMMEQVREAVRAVETLTRRMDEVERRMDTERRDSDASPVVLRVREDTWTAEMRENGRIYVREEERIIGEARIPTDPRPTKDEAATALTSALRQCRRMREAPGTPAVPTPADDCLMAPEIQR